MIDPSVRARVLGISTSFEQMGAGGVLFLPQQVAVFAQGATASTFPATKFQAFTSTQVGQILGFGSPAHLMAQQLLPDNGDGVGTIPVWVYPMSNAGGATVATGDITPGGTITKAGAYRVRVNNILSEEFQVSVAATVAARVASMIAAVNAVLGMPILVADGTTKLDVTSKWQGVSANGIKLEVIGPTTAETGATWAFTQPAGGTVNPSIQPFLDQVGSQWISMGVTSLPVADTTNLDIVQTWGEGRWGETVRRPLVMFWGNTAAAVANAIAVPNARKLDRINAQLVSPGTNDLPFVVAARQLARIAKLANENPPCDYGSQQATGLTPGADSDQWDLAKRQAALVGGSSSVEVNDGVVSISDVVTFFHPTGDMDPAYRYVCDIVKLQTIIYNYDVEFSRPEWDGAPLIPDDQPVTNGRARKPKSIKTAANAITDKLALQAIISDPKTAKKRTTCTISSTNPKRWDLAVPLQLSGNGNVKNVDVKFGFFYGAAIVL